MSEPRKHSGRSMFVGATLAVGACFFLYAIDYTWHTACADFLSLRTRSDMAQWKQDGKVPPPVEWRAYKDTLETALSYTPDNPEYTEGLAYLYASRGLAALNFPGISHSMLNEALLRYRHAAQLRPLSSGTWASIALAKHYLDEDDAELWNAFDKAMAYGSNRPDTLATLFTIGLQRWPTLDSHREAALRAAYARAMPDVKKRLQAIAQQGKHPELTEPTEVLGG